MSLLNGKLVSNILLEKLKSRVQALYSKNIIPGLGVIMVGNNIASKTYVNMKRKKCESLGIYCNVKTFEDDVSEEVVKSQIQLFNENDNIHGILVQLPLPSHMNTNSVLDCVSYKKDVDGFHPINAGRLAQRNNPLFVPCTPRGCIELLDYYNITIEGKNATIVGASNLVGLPLSLLLLSRKATVTICHSKTQDTKSMVQQADLVFTACGCTQMVQQDWIKDGAVIVDIGINKLEDASRKRGYRLVGDVDFENVKDKCSYITPVPGGIGPMTIAMLMTQVVESAESVEYVKTLQNDNVKLVESENTENISEHF
jgi:5,10-methylene-tetrahydrofolate dehydrogenase/methenyl tetrahydrofolate cyclohydrolase